MKVGVIQSCFIPWRGYFDFIRSVNLFVFYDDVQYSKNGWRNRNRIKTPDGSRWITVPVRRRSLSQRICDTEIDESSDWRSDHFRLWSENYSMAPHFNDVLALLGDLGRETATTISELNISLTKAIAGYLGIETQFMLSSELHLTGTKTDRLIDLLIQVGTTTYLSGPSADSYLDKDAFHRSGIGLMYKSYDYAPYPQQWGKFEGAVSILDLIANCGHGAKNHIRSQTPDVIIAP